MSRNKPPLNIPQRWLDCPRKGMPINKMFLPFKTPLDSRYDDQIDLPKRFNLPMLFASCKSSKLSIGFIIDLTNTSRFYDRSALEDEGIQYMKLQCRGHGETPSVEQTNLFINVCHQYITHNPLKTIGVHCTHGFNRTGFLIISYLVEKMDWSLDAAMGAFVRSRPPGIYKQDYIEELYKRYEDMESAPSAPALPDWCTEPDDEVTPPLGGLVLGKRPGDDNDDNEAAFKRRKEMDRKDAVFMDGKVPGVFVVNDQAVRTKVQRTVQKMCKWRQSGFPGSQPVSMDLENLKKLGHKPYKVSWKADGMRYLMLIDGHRKSFMLDRDNQVFQVPNLTFPRRKDLESHIENTLVDGEMIMDIVNGHEVPRFLIYDIIKFETMDVGGTDFDRRLLCINKEIIGPRNQKIELGRLDKTSETLSIRAKPFWELTCAKQLLEGKFSKQVSHETDGLIFQPACDTYMAGRCDDVMKWKPPDLNTVDFKLSIKKVTKRGCLPETHGYLFVGGMATPFSTLKVTNHMKQYDGKIIECSWDAKGKKWSFLRQRTDKSFPNAQSTAMAVCQSISSPVTKDLLFSFIDYKRWRPKDRELMPPPPSNSTIVAKAVATGL